MTGPTAYGTALAADHGAGAALGAALMTAGRYIQAHPGEPVSQDARDRVHRALDAYADSTRPVPAEVAA
jgi:hypothetical protein